MAREPRGSQAPLLAPEQQRQELMLPQRCLTDVCSPSDKSEPQTEVESVCVCANEMGNDKISGASSVVQFVYGDVAVNIHLKLQGMN